MKIGITTNELNVINKLLEQYRNNYTFFFYGSRITSTFQDTSDLDILIKGNEKMPLTTLCNLRDAFDASSLPFIVNFCDYFDITEKFYNLIKDDLINTTKLQINA